MSQFRWLFAAAGAALGVVALALAHNLQAQVQSPGGQILPPRAVTRTCNVSPALGTFKGVWEGWLLFEDAAGTLSAVDERCEVRQTIRRQ